MNGDRNEDEDDVAWVSFSLLDTAQQRMIRGTTWCQWRIQILIWTGTMTALSTRIHPQWDAPPVLRRLVWRISFALVVAITVCTDSQARKQRISAHGGEELRKQAIESNSDLQEIESMDHCPTCEDLMDDVDNISEIISDACQGIDFKTMQIGVHIPKDLMGEEDAVRSRYGAPGSSPLKATLSKRYKPHYKAGSTDIEFVKERPDIMILIDTLTLRVEVDVRPVFIYGRYIKNTREIPQTRWPCRSCRGRRGGCEACESSGLQYPDSVQDLIGRPPLQEWGLDTAFHGMGREDIDVRCPGEGRPFVLEVKSPRSRSPELADQNQ